MGEHIETVVEIVYELINREQPEPTDMRAQRFQ